MAKPKTRNNNTLTESAYLGMIRSVLRRGFRYWKPLQQAKLDGRRKYTGDNKRQRWEYQCSNCHLWFMGKNIQVDHIIPVGTLTSLEDLPTFVANLTSETGYQLLCKPCHQTKTNNEKPLRNSQTTRRS